MSTPDSHGPRGCERPSGYRVTRGRALGALDARPTGGQLGNAAKRRQSTRTAQRRLPIKALGNSHQ